MIHAAQAHPPSPYRGRFAPTPSGPLHLGSLLTALAGYLDARHAGGQWLLRIDDLDAPRCVPDMDSVILKQLEAHGLHWDESPRYESAYRSRYEAALKDLAGNGSLYACRCTRAELAQRCRAGPDGPVYDGHCRQLALPPEGNALRYALPAGILAFDDGVQGPLRRDAAGIGDFVVRRRDGIPGYHLACIVNEREQNITHVVRGADLIGSSFSQLALMRRFGQIPPRYAHLPLLVDAGGNKLSKQNHAPAVASATAGANLWRCLGLLNHTPPPVLRKAAPAELLAWAIAHWSLASVPRRKTATLEPPA